MKLLKTLILLCATAYLSDCSKNTTGDITIPIPNNDFENWNGFPVLENWKGNSCPPCTFPVNGYIIIKDTSAYHGQFAAKFISPAWAENRFSIPIHPSVLTGYIKSLIPLADTLRIKIRLYQNSIAIDSGEWSTSSSVASYTRIDIPISQNSSSADSAIIRIEGGKKVNTALWVDYFLLVKQE